MTTTTPTIDLVSLIEQCTPVRLAKVANNRLHGTEYAGPCPFCSTGEDRFHVFPESEKPHWFCRVCKRTGDHIDILTNFRNTSYVEACQELGISPGQTISREPSMFYDDAPPCEKWQSMGRILVEKAEHYLWNKAPHALEYLRKRGFKDETIKNARLGYIPLLADGTWFTRPFSDWGLTDEMLTHKQKEKGCVRVPPGISIPWLSDNTTLWKLAVKRFEAGEKEMKYGQVIGSKDALYNADSLQHGKLAVLVEGEFDAISILQECRDLISPIGTGSTEKARIPLWIAKMASLAFCSLIGFDSDQAGDKASEYWLSVMPASMRWQPFSHDCNQMLQDGISIRDWVELGLDTLAVKIDESPLQGSPPAFGDDLSLVCVTCGNPVEYYSSEGVAYCAKDWAMICSDETISTRVHICKQCGKETLREASDGLCSWCYNATLAKANPPREPVAVRDAWLRR